MADGIQMSQLMGSSVGRPRFSKEVTVVCFPSSRQTQWDPPTWDSPGDDASLEHEAEMDLGTPTYDENPMKVRGTNLWDRPWGGRAVWSWERDRSDPQILWSGPTGHSSSGLP